MEEQKSYQELKKENARLKRSNMVLLIFAILVLIAELYNMIF